MPADFRRFEQTWREHQPDWEIRLWTDAEAEALVEPEVLARCRNAAERSDVLRYRILHAHGGVYVDTDVECLRPIDPLLEGASLVVGLEGKRKVGTAIVGAAPHHPAMWRAAEEVAQAAGEGAQVHTTGPHLLTRVVADFPDAKVLPREVLYPRRWFESRIPRATQGQAYTVHHVARAWAGPVGRAAELHRLRAAQVELEARRDRAEARAAKAQWRAEKAQRRAAKAERRAEAAQQQTEAARQRALTAERRWVSPRARALVGSAARRLTRPIGRLRRRP